MPTLEALKNQLGALQTRREELKPGREAGTLSEAEAKEYGDILAKQKATLAQIREAQDEEAVDGYVSASAPAPRGVVEVHNVADESPYALGEFLQDVAYSALNPRHRSQRLEMHQKRNTDIIKREFRGAASGLNELVPSEGGFLVGTDYAPGIIQKTYANSQLAPRCMRYTASANSNGVKMNAVDETSRADGSRHGGVRGYWLAEAGSLTGTKPKFRQMELSLHKLGALYYATDELIQDAALLGSVAEAAVSDELAFKLQAAIFSGDGAGKPYGILSANCVVEVAKETGQTADTIVFENVVKMYSRMWAPSRPNAIWVANDEIIPQLMGMNLATGTGGVPVWLPAGGISGQPFDTLFGKPIIYIEQAEALGDDGDLMFCDFSQYVLLDKGGVQQAASMHVQFTTDEMVFRFIYRVDGQPTWNSALTPYKGAGTKSPFVKLADRA